MITNKSIGKYGRFANGLFQIAAVIGVARKSYQPFGFEPWFNYDHRDRFGSTEDIDLQKYFVNPLPPLNEDLAYQHRFINWGYEDLYLPTGNWDLQGHFQSEKWFKDSIDEVMWYMTMKGEERNNACCIHWRAGDYEEGIHNYHPRQSFEYYKQAINQFPKETLFYIFSDNSEDFYKMLCPLNISCEVIKGNYIDSFRIMKGCKHFITSNSSYSLFAAILGDNVEKKIVCPKLWFGTAANGLETKDLYPEGAIII